MCEFWYDYVKPKYGEKAKLCYVGIDSFIVYRKTDDIYKDIARDVETRSGTSNYESEWVSIDRPLPKGKNKKVIQLMKDELGRKIIAKFVGCWIKSKKVQLVIDDGVKIKSKRHKKVCHKKKT